jgi:hypothetical protein
MMSLEFRFPLAVSGLVLVALAMTGCCDDPEAPDTDPGEPLLTFELGDYFVNMFASEGIVFVSDTGGDILGVGTWSGASNIEIHSDGTRPDTVSFTFVRDQVSGVDLSTEVGIPVGSLVSFEGGYAYNPNGEAELALTNIPAHEYYLIASSLAGVRPPNSIPTLQTIQVHWDAVDVFVRIDPIDGWPQGGWSWGVQPGEVRTMDLAEPGTLAPLIRYATRFPPGGDSVTASLHYDVRAGLVRQAFSFCHDNYEGDAIPDSAIMYGPSIKPEHQTCTFVQRVEGDPRVIYLLEARGVVPTEFTKMPGTLEILSSNPDSAIFTMTGDWDRFAASWDMATSDSRIDWYVEGRAPISAYALPQLPQEVLQLVPDLVREEFVFHNMKVEGETQPGVTHSQTVFPNSAKKPEPDDTVWSNPSGLPPHVWN